MGILEAPAAFVRALPLPKGFTVCELGDQWVTHTLPHVLARDFYRQMGATRYESIDGNGRGTITFDLNRKWHGTIGQFDLVTDCGTGEHIFNQAEVWRTIHTLTKPKGFIVFDRPAAGYSNHGFYNVHETLFRDLAEANRYTVLQLQRAPTTRGELLRGVLQKAAVETKFLAPQQGRYQKALKIGGAA